MIKNCHGLLFETVHNLLMRFPELDFVAQQLCFVDPLRRECICCNMEEILDQFNNNFLKSSTVLCEYALFRNDDKT